MFTRIKKIKTAIIDHSVEIATIAFLGASFVVLKISSDRMETAYIDSQARQADMYQASCDVMVGAYERSIKEQSDTPSE